jgi:hypothetical protein
MRNPATPFGARGARKDDLPAKLIGSEPTATHHTAASAAAHREPIRLAAPPDGAP